jgi:hypothetical protein
MTFNTGYQVDRRPNVTIAADFMESLLAEQASVLTQLDELNARIEEALKRFLPERTEVETPATLEIAGVVNAVEETLPPEATEMQKTITRDDNRKPRQRPRRAA